MAALTGQVEGIQLQPDLDALYYEIKKGTLTKLWQQLEALNDEVLVKYPELYLAGYDSGRYIELEEAT